MIIIQTAKNGDADLIADLSRQTFYETFAPFNTKEDMNKFMNEQFTREQLIKEAKEIANKFILAYNDTKPVGYALMRESTIPEGLENFNTVEIARIYVLNTAIGTGAGKALMEKCIEMAKEINKEIIWLGVWEKNIRAISFYTKWGFEKFAEHPFILGNDIQTDWLMKKTIKPVFEN